MKLRLLACAALLAAGPLVSTFAAEPSIGAGNNREATEMKDGAAGNTHGAMPMAGGSMAAAPVGAGNVPGDNSTVAGDRAGTAVARSGAGGADGNK